MARFASKCVVSFLVAHVMTSAYVGRSFAGGDTSLRALLVSHPATQLDQTPSDDYPAGLLFPGGATTYRHEAGARGEKRSD